jgi:hypothetical protein
MWEVLCGFISIRYGAVPICFRNLVVASRAWVYAVYSWRLPLLFVNLWIK